MIPVVIDRPYRFRRPYPSEFWLRLIRPVLPVYLRRSWGVESIEFHGVHHLQRSFEAGHGILLAPNHARPCDPFVIGLLPLRLGKPPYFVAAAHVFETGGRFNAWLVRRLGAFSIHRWGTDRESLKASIDILVEARRPLLVFPEGMITRTNDRLRPLLEGTAFVARSAAKHRAKQGQPGKVVVHPVVIRYTFQGNLRQSVEGVLADIERRLGWQPRPHCTVLERVRMIGGGLLTLKEVEFLGRAQSGPIHERREQLIESILAPMERQWLGTAGSGPVVERVKKLRTALLPGLIETNSPVSDRDLRWRHVADCYLAQQIDCYPADYLREQTSVDRVLETVERFEEDLTDHARIHRPLKADVWFAPAIEVAPTRDRHADDALMAELERQLRAILVESQSLSRPYVEPRASACKSA